MITNPNFELTDPSEAIPGVPSDWEVDTTGEGEETAEFEGDLGLNHGPYESFDHGWSSTDPQVLANSLGVAEHVPADAMSRWFVNQTIMVLGALVAAVFNTSPTVVDSFEVDWSPALDDDFVLDGEELASAAYGDQATDNFLWGSVVFSLTSVVSATFDSGTREQFNSWTEEL